MRSQYIGPVMRFLPRFVTGPSPSWCSLPSQCAVCRSWGSQRLCRSCIERFAAPVLRCDRCAIAVPPGVSICGACLRSPPPFERTLAAVDYTYPWDTLITQFKFHAALDLAPTLVAALVRACQHDTAGTPRWLLPVPLGPRRLRERGYNQAWELARRLARTLDCEADPGLLLRVKDTRHQRALPRAEREANVRGVFTVAPHRAHGLRGRDVTLVDDVMTTGSTAAEAARTLLHAGAASVRLWVVARTPAPNQA